MAWIALISSVLVLWFASLCKVFLESLSFSKATFLNDGVSSRRRNILLVIAHPDDESMFFAPVINYVTSRHHNVHILCMSTGFVDLLRIFSDLTTLFGNVGNADGMGSIRKEELYLASVVLKIITFEDYGISGHCNHCDVHQGVRKLLHDASGRHLEAWAIVSPNIVRKYIGPVDIWLSILFSRLKKDGPSYCLLNLDLRKGYAAMAQHFIQWVWRSKIVLPSGKLIEITEEDVYRVFGFTCSDKKINLLRKDETSDLYDEWAMRNHHRKWTLNHRPPST
ncbi:uncharacterized protein LOC130991023 [Salvia miltiorrhiza]|uniref:uncharacterized protein LOC130991023 n=1 Tax=Salvia miltiorrhiza TaxID=226208 RepID=UPI0025AD6575|nr:uncharacterized protein LOC130991023 [Salvia miltiorrhiza]